MLMDFIITYVVSFFVCLFTGEIFYMKSDRGLFKMIGLLPVVNCIVATVMLAYTLYTFINIYLSNRKQEKNERLILSHN